MPENDTQNAHRPHNLSLQNRTALSIDTHGFSSVIHCLVDLANDSNETPLAIALEKARNLAEGVSNAQDNSAHLTQRLQNITDEFKASYAICLILEAYPQLRFLSQSPDNRGLKFIPTEWAGLQSPDEIDFWDSLSQPEALTLAQELLEEIGK
jgi:hypothetical protein